MQHAIGIEPLVAFAFLRRSPLAVSLGVARPAIGRDHAQRHPIGGEGMAVVQDQADGAALDLGADRPHVPGIPMAGVVERSGVLGDQHQRVFGHALDHRLAVGINEVRQVHVGVLEETVSAYGTRPVGAASRETGRLESAPEVLGDLVQALFQARIPHPETAKFVFDPVFGVRRTLVGKAGRPLPQGLLDVWNQRANPEGLDDAVPASGALADAFPAGCLVAGAVVIGMDEGLQQYGAHPVTGFPVVGQLPCQPAEQMGR